mmetsp:Transcript_89337/g.158495  ORF Transcript_89337/g.158495 Transcript_89337/m.158495 type:complete len:205 (+) Transcript_89337:211-825(+)
MHAYLGSHTRWNSFENSNCCQIAFKANVQVCVVAVYEVQEAIALSEIGDVLLVVLSERLVQQSDFFNVELCLEFLFNVKVHTLVEILLENKRSVVSSQLRPLHAGLQSWLPSIWIEVPLVHLVEFQIHFEEDLLVPWHVGKVNVFTGVHLNMVEAAPIATVNSLCQLFLNCLIRAEEEWESKDMGIVKERPFCGEFADGAAVWI